MKKQIASKMSSSEYMIFNHSLCTILILIYFIYLKYNNDFSTLPIKNLSNKEILISIVASITTVAATVFLISLLKNNDASYIIPHVQPCVILLTMLLGYYLYNEDVTKTKALGGILIIGGLMLMNKK
jgi:uncharacterized membrane protein